MYYVPPVKPLNRPIMGLTLNGPFQELGYCYNGIVWAIACDPNKAIDVGEWSIFGGDRLERFLLYMRLD